MTAAAIWELQQALFTALDEDATLSGLISGVFDFVPQDTAFPYVVLERFDGEDWSTSTTEGCKIRCVVTSFSREGGKEETLSIMERIKELLHDADLSLTGYDLVNLRGLSGDVALESDGITYRGMQRFIATVQET